MKTCSCSGFALVLRGFYCTLYSKMPSLKFLASSNGCPLQGCSPLTIGLSALLDV